MKEGFIKLDGQDKPQKMFYEPKQNANNKTLVDMPKIQQCSHEWLGDASVFVSSLVLQGGILSFENTQGVLKYFQKLWLESMTRFHPLTQKHTWRQSSIIEKTECIIFNATALIQMLPILSKTAKVTSVAIVEQFRVYIL